MNHNIEHQDGHDRLGVSSLKISMRRGINGWFDVDGLIIRLWASNWTGREIVRVEDEQGERVVSDQRSFKFNTPHEFSVGPNDYRLEVRMSFAKVELRLFRNGALVDSDEFSQHKHQVRINPETGQVDWKHVLKTIVVLIGAGLVLGAGVGYGLGSLARGWFA